MTWNNGILECWPQRNMKKRFHGVKIMGLAELDLFYVAGKDQKKKSDQHPLLIPIFHFSLRSVGSTSRRPVFHYSMGPAFVVGASGFEPPTP
jgi:hypothetical protein